MESIRFTELEENIKIKIAICKRQTNIGDDEISINR